MFASRRVALPFRHSSPFYGPGWTSSQEGEGIYFCVIAKDAFEPEVKLEVGLEGENTGGKQCLSRRRFERRRVANAESACGNYKIRAFLLEASRSICKAGNKVVEDARLWC